MWREKIHQAEGGKKKLFYLDASHQKAFESTKSMIARDVVLAYPDFNEESEIYADVSLRQLGAVIVKNNRHVAFFSRTLSAEQQTILSQSWNSCL